MKKLIVLILVLTISLFATNGMNTIGYGVKSNSMGGVTFLINDAALLASNPAIIGFSDRSSLSFDIGLMMPAVHFKNSNNDLDGKDQIFPLPQINYLHNTGGAFNYGISFYTQGGMGATYEMNHNLYRNMDGSFIQQKYHSKIAYMKLTTALSYNVNDKLSVGIAPSIGYAMLEMKMPYSMTTSAMQGVIPGQGGMTFGQMFGAPQTAGGLGYSEVTATADMEDGVSAIGFGGTIGLAYKVNEKLSVGLSYSMQSDLAFEGEAEMNMFSQFGDAFGRMVQGALMQMGVNPQDATAEQLQQAQGAIMRNFTAMGFTELANADGSMNPNSVKASYDAEVEMSWPQLVDFSLSYSPLKSTTIYVDIKWIDWETAMKDFKMTMTNGSNANINIMMGSDEVTMVMPLNWENQLVFALGVNHIINDMISLRLGYNYGKNPVPAETLIPIFPAVVEQHFTVGVSINATDRIGIDLGCEFVPEVESTVGATESIIANEYNGSTCSLSELLFHFGINYSF